MSARRATIADVARAAGVSPSTASVVFSGRAPVTDPTRQRVIDAAQRLGYTGPDPRAASLRRGSSGIVGVVVGARLGAVFSDPVTRLQMDGLAEGLAGVGAGLLLLQDTGEEAAGPSLLTTPLDAAVLVGCNARMRDSLQVLRARDVPVVVIEGDGGDGVPQIRLDNREAQRELATHLAGLGHRDVAILTLPTAAGRPPGWLDAAAEAEIQVDVAADRLAGAREVYPEAPAYAAGASLIDEGLAAGRMLLADPAARPTAVLAQSDLLAAGVVRAAEEAGLRVPHDLSVTGFDGVVVDGLSPYELTTAVQPAAEKGRAAGSAVAAMLAGSPAESLGLTCTFRAGNTTGPAPAG
ncbi:LacI family DNA-binding transcriptional regulator [Microbacterium wangchenii]|uniref:LacI family DNA-binding transcriptional regulator n=1 Tax=Microbacterium wangchenii TaxID=2541726 RepID=UPI0011CC78FF|nr:LacI family DNA-binding transcriptional regulator [Microbacterium wangchenii]TXK14578.1 LacI family transcriptional regulator [Microbacterium wangchenii]